jgi:monoamine oxidase
VTVGRSRSGRGQTYAARAVVVTLPLGVLKARTGRGAVQFLPRLNRKQDLIERMQVGHVLRLAIRFRERMWRRLLPKVLQSAQGPGFGFLHSQAKGIPVWWSLSDQPILVGWAGGPVAKALLRLSGAARRRLAIQSLAGVLGVAPRTLRKSIVDWQGRDWTRDPYSRGAYSFIAAGSDGAGEELRRPVRDTIFFAGEATADGAEVGTVHGALRSGIRAAKKAGRALRRRRP